MTPAARAAAVIELIDAWAEGAPVERLLTNWARAARYAGSSDRRAVRDLVFDVLRRRRSAGWMGGGESGRALVLGLCRLEGIAPDSLFTGAAHAPAPLSGIERESPAPLADAPLPVRLDWPDWLWEAAVASLGEALEPALEALRHRAPVTVRVNLARMSREEALARLAEAGLAARPLHGVSGAVVIEGEARGLKGLDLWRDGLIELQDAASQALVEALPLVPGMRVLDLCAGGGGKTLAMAARAEIAVFAHDAHPARMRDLPRRASRAGIAPRILPEPKAPERHAPYDVVLADVPCSGSGAWARNPEGKWRLTRDGFEQLVATQRGILARAAALVRPGGALAYATCSLLDSENRDQIARLLARSTGWTLEQERRWLPGAPGDGFYLAVLRKA
jgi:16S rRNA (cytosine967-C5)-methyltransferase